MAPRSSTSSVILLLVAGLLLVALGLAWGLRGGSGPPDSTSSQREPAPVAASTSAEAPPAATRAVPESPDPGIPLTDLPLRLVATVVRENPALSLATVEDLDRTRHEVLNEGDSFRDHPQASVVRIERGRILLDNDGVREQLVIDRSDRAPLDVAAVSPEEAERRRQMGRRLRALTEAGEDYEQVLGEGERGGLLAEGDVSAVYAEDGEMIGVRLDDIRSGGLYDRIGLRSGDVVTNINGISLGEPAAIARVMAQLATADEVTVGIQAPNGGQETLSIPAADLLRGLGDLSE